VIYLNEKELYLNPNPNDHITAYGKSITYKTCDGKEFATMEEVMQYNHMFYESMMNNSKNNEF